MLQHDDTHINSSCFIFVLLSFLNRNSGDTVLAVVVAVDSLECDVLDHVESSLEKTGDVRVDFEINRDGGDHILQGNFRVVFISGDDLVVLDEYSVFRVAFQKFLESVEEAHLVLVDLNDVLVVLSEGLGGQFGVVLGRQDMEFNF